MGGPALALAKPRDREPAGRAPRVPARAECARWAAKLGRQAGRLGRDVQARALARPGHPARKAAAAPEGSVASRRGARGGLRPLAPLDRTLRRSLSLPMPGGSDAPLRLPAGAPAAGAGQACLLATSAAPGREAGAAPSAPAGMSDPSRAAASGPALRHRQTHARSHAGLARSRQPGPAPCARRDRPRSGSAAAPAECGQECRASVPTPAAGGPILAPASAKVAGGGRSAILAADGRDRSARAAARPARARPGPQSAASAAAASCGNGGPASDPAGVGDARRAGARPQAAGGRRDRVMPPLAGRGQRLSGSARGPRGRTRAAALGLALALGLPAAAPAAPALEAALDALRARCGSDGACLAAGIARDLPAGSRLQPVPPPDTDRIRWAATARSLGRIAPLGDGRLVELRRFGRRLLQELPAALPARGPLWLDLRANGGGDLVRMLAAAGWLTGPVPGALELAQAGARRWLDIPGPPGRRFAGRLVVLVGPATASSAEALAALLRRHAGARILGDRTAGKTWLDEIRPLGQGWRVLVPGASLRVPGVDWQGGLAPDGPLDPKVLAGSPACAMEK
jgi:hypothetical protein